MIKNKNNIYIIVLLIAIISIFIATACANQGAPSGGPYDMTPPKVLRFNPDNRAININTNKIKISFDENIKLADLNKIIVSPLQKEEAVIEANGKDITIRLKDTIKENTTYAIYFDDAIVDYNEDNPIEDFYYSFSTGNKIDSMRILGFVLDAENLEPIADMSVGAFFANNDFRDSIVFDKRYEYATKTNKVGRFSFYALPDSVYRIFAIGDTDRDAKYNPQGESFASLAKTLKTSLLDSIKIDTLRRDSIVRRDTIHIDSIYKRDFTYYYPNDVVLLAYKAENKQKGISSSKMLDTTKISIEFFESLDTIPNIKLINQKGIKDSLYIADINENKATYYLLDKSLYSLDSLEFTLQHNVTDSLLNITNKLDTIKFFRPRIKNDNSERDSTFSIEFKQSSSIYQNTILDTLYLLSKQPILNLDKSKINFEIAKNDTVYEAYPFSLIKDKNNVLRYNIDTKIEEDKKYRLRIDSASIFSIYGLPNDELKSEINIAKSDELGAIELSITNIDSLALVQLLDDRGNFVYQKYVDKVIKDSIATDILEIEKLEKSKALNKSINDSIANDPILSELAKNQKEANDTTLNIEKDYYKIKFEYLKPAKYYVRIIVDKDKNSKWTTGEYPIRMPESVYYLPKELEVKKGITVQELWNATETPLNKQKPEALRKVKEEPKKMREDKNIQYYKDLESKKRRS